MILLQNKFIFWYLITEKKFFNMALFYEKSGRVTVMSETSEKATSLLWDSNIDHIF